MPKLCVYVMDHDTGYAPRVTKKTCTLKGCMEYSIEKSAEGGDWIIGIGGKTVGSTKGNGGKYDRKLIYAMKVNENPNNTPRSKDFYYFGNNAIELPNELQELAPIVKHPFRKKYFRDSPLFPTFEKFIRGHRRENGLPCDKSECD